MEERKKCEYCFNTFKDSYKLKNHQKTAKYCVEIQRKKTEKDVEKEADKEVISKLLLKLATLQRENSCLKEQLQERKKELEENRQVIIDIAKTPKQINNTTNNNLLMMTPFEMNTERFSNTIRESFTRDYMIEGQKGVAKFAVDKLLRDENGKLQYVCTDPSRQIYKFKTIDGDMERDVKAQKLTKSIVDELKKKAQNITVETITDDSDIFMLITNNFQDINEMDTNNSDFRNTLASLTTN